MSRRQWACMASAALLALLWPGASVAQTLASPPNRFTPTDDVEIGLHAAALVEDRLPVLHDEAVTRCVAAVACRLVAALPSELRHPEFHYYVQVIGVREIDARALPGGPIYLNRGLVESARTAGELAGVIAHEVSHIALRHGTAQATRVTESTVAAVTRALLDAIDDGPPGGSRSVPGAVDAATALLRLAPESERQADALAVQLMARAGYDPQELAAVVRAIGRADGTWLTDGGESARRHEAIARDAASLRVENTAGDRTAFERARARLRRMTPSPAQAAALRNRRRRDRTASLDPTRPARVEAASARFTTYTERNLFRVRVPANWRELADVNAVVFAPRGAYGQTGGEMAFTHGVEIGLAPRRSDDLGRATDALIDLLAADSPNLRRLSAAHPASLGKQPAVRVVVSNVSAVTGEQERMEMLTTLLRDGRLFYALLVAPRDQFGKYERTFREVVSSIAIIE